MLTVSKPESGPRGSERAPGRMRGQAAVEFALIAGVLILIMVGTLEVGRLMFINAELTNAAAEGANYAALHNPAGDLTFQSQVRAAAMSKLTLADKNAFQATASCTTCPFCPVSVTVTDTWSSALPILGGGTIVRAKSKLIEYVPTPGACP